VPEFNHTVEMAGITLPVAVTLVERVKWWVHRGLVEASM